MIDLFGNGIAPTITRGCPPVHQDAQTGAQGSYRRGFHRAVRSGSGSNLAGDRAITHSRQYGADQRRDPKQPKLRDRPASDDDRRPRAPRWIHRRIGDGDADQVNDVRAMPMASGANPFGARSSVAPSMINKNINVMTNSVTKPDTSE